MKFLSLLSVSFLMVAINSVAVLGQNPDQDLDREVVFEEKEIFVNAKKGNEFEVGDTLSATGRVSIRNNHQRPQHYTFTITIRKVSLAVDPNGKRQNTFQEEAWLEKGKSLLPGESFTFSQSVETEATENSTSFEVIYKVDRVKTINGMPVTDNIGAVKKHWTPK